ncbi:hypothetical protein GGR52DRAFT_340424 [Hypoxylon sp. FL1284]|nr:hypothetical protein GGR52DRAFT_340424 [Hypoxylon sp. FL1284]
MIICLPSGKVVNVDLDHDDRVVLYIMKGELHNSVYDTIANWTGKADQTNWINFIKPLILAEELQIPYLLSLVDTKGEEYRKIHPERYVPALRDIDPQSRKEVTVFESTACLQYLSDRFDHDGEWTGRNAWEKAQVLSWTAYQTAGLG